MHLKKKCFGNYGYKFEYQSSVKLLKAEFLTHNLEDSDYNTIAHDSGIEFVYILN